MLLREAFNDHAVTYACTLAGVGKPQGLDRVELIPDCNRHDRLGIVRLGWRALTLLVKLRPQVIVSTGALPGLAFIIIGRLLGCRTIWVESMANSEVLSLSGQWATRIAHECFVQWPQLEMAGKTRYAGSVL